MYVISSSLFLEASSSVGPSYVRVYDW